MADHLAALPEASSQLQGMQRILLSHACTADVVLDLHCDAEAALHMYALPQHWPQWRSLAAHLNVRVGLLAEDSGGSSFDEACSLPWLRLSRLFPDAQIPLLWAAVSAVAMLFSTPLSALSDRVGRVRLFGLAAHDFTRFDDRASKHQFHKLALSHF